MAAAVSAFFNHPALDAFGFHGKYLSNGETLSRVQVPSEHNVKNLLGYLPILNFIGGNAHINEGNCEFNAKTVRGNMEILFFGPLFFVLDLLVTLGRFIGLSCTICAKIV